MKRLSKYIILSTIAGFLLASCDFLDKPPYDKIPDPDFWKEEKHARSFAYSFYGSLFPGYGSGASHGSFLLGQTLNDDMALNPQTNFSPDKVADASTWNYENVRKSNYMIRRAGDMKGLISDEGVNHWVGIGHFFRAAFHASLAFSYGDIPYMDREPAYSQQNPVKEEKDYLYKDRDPRTYVALKNLEDFRFAIDNVRENDGALNINKYVVAAYAARAMLNEGTFLKYHDVDQEVAKKCIEFAKEAAEVVMAGPYKVSDNFNALFASEDLSTNTEVIMYRKYVEGLLVHTTLAYSNNETQMGPTKSLAESFLTKSGLPVYCTDPNWMPKTSEEFFKDRDPRLAKTFRTQYYLKGEDNTPFGDSNAGYAWNKFMDDSKGGSTDLKYGREKNITDAPCLRLGEVLLIYAEACYELGNISQEDLDKSINLLRARAGMEIPKLQILSGQPAVGGVAYDDPKRDQDVPSLLWEIRRERRVEMAFEGLRLSDLKRWKKYDYLYNGTNPDIRFGAYIRYADYPKVDKVNTKFEDAGAVEGYILINKDQQRMAPVDRNYVAPIPKSQIQAYADHGYTLSQTKEWEGVE